jgi:ankyrin repeat protein
LFLGYAPVHLAAAEGHASVVEYLVGLGADVDEMVSYKL